MDPYSIAKIVTFLEQGNADQLWHVLSTPHLESITEFTNYLTTIGPVSPLGVERNRTDDLTKALQTLESTVKAALQVLNASQKNRQCLCTYECGKCGATLTGNSMVEIWEQHDHIEELLAERSGSVSPNVSLARGRNETLNSSREPASSQNEELGKNDFLFKFIVDYVPEVKKKLYPAMFLNAMKKFDTTSCYTLQRCGPQRGMCLLCSCELNTKTKLSQKALYDHVLGAKHMKFTLDPEHLIALEDYHEAFLHLDADHQAHQIHFRPKMERVVKCSLCNSFVLSNVVSNHIHSEQHKRFFKELVFSSDHDIYLLDLQANVYKDESLNKALKKYRKRVDDKALEQTENVKKKKPKKSPTDSAEVLRQHVMRRAVDDPSSETVLGLLPKRYEAHSLHFHEVEPKVILCSCCDMIAGSDLKEVIRHIKEPIHLKKSKVPFLKYAYYCAVCKSKPCTETYWREHCEMHVTDEFFKEYYEVECVTCNMVLFGKDEHCAQYHSEAYVKYKEHQRQGVVLPESIQHMFSSKTLIQYEAERLTAEANCVVGDELTLRCCAHLEEVLKSVSDYCKVYPFGSRISGLGNKDSDLDMFMDSGGMYTGDITNNSHAQVMLAKRVYSALLKCKDHFTDIVHIATARTPIVKFKHLSTNIDCDLSFKHGLSVENTKFLRFCLAIQPVAQPMILLLKFWSQHNNCFNQKITTYTLAILAIFYLQTNDYLLSVKEIRAMNGVPVDKIGGWETIKYVKPLEEMKKDVEPYPHHISELLKDFFDFYKHFPYNKLVICPLLGCPIKKQQFYKTGKDLPPEMQPYLKQLKGPDPEPFRVMSSICVQDPFDLSHNLTKACDKHTLNKFTAVCGLTIKHLNSLG